VQRSAPVEASASAAAVASRCPLKLADVAFDDGCGYHLRTHAQELGDAALAVLRAWIIERYDRRSAHAGPQVRVAVCDE
jgi:hypothetical protein